MIGVFSSIRRTPYQSMAGFLVLFFAIFLSTALLISVSFLEGLLNYVETRPQVTVYFQRSSSEDEVNKLRDALMKSDKILSVKYISKDEAFKIYKELNKNKPLLLEMVSANILPASLEIHAKKLEFLPQIVEFSKKQDGVDEVRFSQDNSERLKNLTTIVRKIALFLFMYLIVMSVVVLSTTTLFKIAMKKDEIELLRLLGASNFYIRKPYIKETLTLSLLASICSFGVTLIALYALKPSIEVYLESIPALTLPLNGMTLTVWPININYLGLAFVLTSFFSILVAITGSYIATQRYLK